VHDNNNDIPRSVRLADVLVIFSALLHNIVSSFQAFTEELLDLSVYNANRESKVSRAWQQFTQDLETMEEENG
jgi:hypothetical protein